VPPKKSAPAVETPAEVDPQAALSALSEQILQGKSGMIALKANFTAIAIVDNKVVELPMGSFQSVPRENKPKADGTFSRGFHISGKLSDPTLVGQAHGTRLQVGANITVIGSKAW